MRRMVGKPCKAWTYSDALETRNESYETPQTTALYRLLAEAHARIRELERASQDVRLEGARVSELLRRQA